MKSGLLVSLLAAGTLTMGLANSASAVVYNINTLDGSQGWYSNDTRAGGSVELTTLGGQEALVLTTDSTIAGSSQAKASVMIDLTGPKPLKNFGLGKIVWYRDSSSSDSSAGQIPNIRLVVQNSNGDVAELVWEWAETVGGPAVEDEWVTYSFGGSTNGVWIYSDGHNYFNPPTSLNDGTVASVPGQYVQTQSYWAYGGTITDGAFTSPELDEWTQVIGIKISMGSGVEGYYKAAIQSLQFAYSPIQKPANPGDTIRPVKPVMHEYYFLAAEVIDGNTTAATPEPATAALGLLAAGGLAMATRRRRV